MWWVGWTRLSWTWRGSSSRVRTILAQQWLLARVALGGARLGGAPGVQLHQLDLHVALALARRRRAAPPDVVRTELPRALVVGEGPFQSVHQLLLSSGVQTGAASSTRWSRLRGIR